MAIIIEDPELGNYYKGLIPYVESMSVSLDIETNIYSLECDKTYNHEQYIGLFYGYPGSMDSDGKFIPGINHANGIIFIGKNDNIEVVDGIIKKGLIKESEIESEIEESKIESEIEESGIKSGIESGIEKKLPKNLNSSYGRKIVPQCTFVECGINFNSELMIHREGSYSSNKIYGMFSGTPGEFYYDNKIKGYNRIYGNEYSIGTIIMYGRFNFKYNYDKGKISSIIFNNSNSLKYKQLLESINF